MNKEDAEQYHALSQLRLENALLRKENAELKERWRKTHEPSELRVQLARAIEEIAELKREVRPVKPDEYNESYSKSLSQKL
jgi:hypothetical protein